MTGYDCSRHTNRNGKSMPIPLDPNYRRSVPNSR
jgi:hypothetical protein